MDYINAQNIQGQGQGQDQHPDVKPQLSNSSISPPPGRGSTSQSPPTANNAASAGPTQAQAPRIRRRNRMITSCLECRRRKLKCNKSHPCTNCVKFTRDCVFLAPALDQASQLKLTEIKEKVGSLERLLERDVAKNAAPAPVASPSQDRALPDDADDDLPPNEDEKDLEPTPLAVVDAAYDVDGDDDDLLDLGIQLGKMRITERIGGFFRPKISQEVCHTFSIVRLQFVTLHWVMCKGLNFLLLTSGKTQAGTIIKHQVDCCLNHQHCCSEPQLNIDNS
jgi:hypothetical protein